ncbi:MAG: GntR family transcriptional regulator [Anaerolineae bacterium]|nr:GntR family transcriptional regulator [Anaerolineae bacterium]
MVELRIDQESRIPIYVQIEEQLRSLILAGQLKPGDQLPTIRELATELRVNYNTVARAYLDLDREGIISTQQGRGTFVAGVPNAGQMAHLRRKKLEAIVQTALDEARRLGYTLDEIAAVFEEGMARWLHENGQNQSNQEV